jgi:sirohydrochlorin cobaltochelatase
MRRIVALPYFLQLGRHVAEDLPALIAQAEQRHPHAALVLARHLGYDRALVDVVADRVAEAVALA